MNNSPGWPEFKKYFDLCNTPGTTPSQAELAYAEYQISAAEKHDDPTTKIIWINKAINTLKKVIERGKHDTRSIYL